MERAQKIGLSTDTKAECLALIIPVCDSALDMKEIMVLRSTDSSLSIEYECPSKRSDTLRLLRQSKLIVSDIR